MLATCRPQACVCACTSLNLCLRPCGTLHAGDWLHSSQTRGSGLWLPTAGPAGVFTGGCCIWVLCSDLLVCGCRACPNKHPSGPAWLSLHDAPAVSRASSKQELRGNTDLRESCPGMLVHNYLVGALGVWALTLVPVRTRAPFPGVLMWGLLWHCCWLGTLLPTCSAGPTTRLCGAGLNQCM